LNNLDNYKEVVPSGQYALVVFPNGTKVYAGNLPDGYQDIIVIKEENDPCGNGELDDGEVCDTKLNPKCCSNDCLSFKPVNTPCGASNNCQKNYCLANGSCFKKVNSIAVQTINVPKGKKIKSKHIFRGVICRRVNETLTTRGTPPPVLTVANVTIVNGALSLDQKRMVFCNKRGICNNACKITINSSGVPVPSANCNA
jgi:hypothetical protein